MIRYIWAYFKRIKNPLSVNSRVSMKSNFYRSGRQRLCKPLRTIALTLWSGTTSRFHLAPPHIFESIYCIVDVREPASGISSKERFWKEWGAMWEWLGGQERQWTEGGHKREQPPGALRQSPSLFPWCNNDYNSENKGRPGHVSSLLVITCFIGNRRWDGWSRATHITVLTNHCYRPEVSSPFFVKINDCSFLSLQLRKIRQPATISGSWKLKLLNSDASSSIPQPAAEEGGLD